MGPKRTSACVSRFKSNLTFPLEEKRILMHIVSLITTDQSKRNKFVKTAKKKKINK